MKRYNPSSDKIFLWGLPGSGKSTLGKHLASILECSFTDLDREITKATGREIPDIFSTEGEDRFRDYERQAIDSILEQGTGIIATGGGAPCFFDNAEKMNDAGFTIFLDVPVNELVIRLQGKTGRPLVDKSDDLSASLTRLRGNRLKYYLTAKLVVKNEETDLLDKIGLFFQT